MAEPDALLRRTRIRLLVVTLVLLGTLVVGIGLVAAIAGLATLDADVDRSLAAAVAAAAANPRSDASGDSEDAVPAAADTFVLYLDRSGSVVANPSRARLAGLPDLGAVAAVADDGGGHGPDWRTVTAGGVAVRLLTEPVAPSEGPVRFVQGGFVLTLHDEQSRSLVGVIVGTGGVGLVAAAVVALVVTRRALVPIRASIAAQRRFVADASHELRTPVTIIHADAEVLQREGHVAGAGADLLEDIVEESARMGRLLADLLTLSSVEAAPRIQRADLDLAALARSTVRRMAPVAAARGVRIEVTAPSPAELSGDADRLVQAIVVLLDNAVRHTEPGTSVDVSVASRGAEIVLAVRDHGPGVRPEDRERIFEPFTRARRAVRAAPPPGAPWRDAPSGSATSGESPRAAPSSAAPSRAGEGAGLGLSIARSIVDAHGGGLTVSNAPGGGAIFEMALPRR